MLNRRDPAHERAIAASQAADQPILTTEFVLELADALSNPSQREELRAVFALIDAGANCKVVPAGSELLRRGMALYLERADKEWQVTDCISFVVMEDEGIKDALTGDRHFEQAGFRALLR